MILSILTVPLKIGVNNKWPMAVVAGFSAGWKLATDQFPPGIIEGLLVFLVADWLLGR
jgi:hypothetical protein